MYYHVTKLDDWKTLAKKYPNIDTTRLKNIVNIALNRADFRGRAAISINNSCVEYCSLQFYKDNEPDYGTQGKLITTIKY